MKPDIDLLKEIKQVETPPFLFTRIEQKIREKQKEFVQPKWLITTIISCALLFYLNFMAINKQTIKINHQHDNASEMNFYPDNSLYQ